MKEVALQIGKYNLDNPTPTFINLGDFLSKFLNVVIYIAGALLIFWGVWGVMEYIFAGGEKEKLGKAKARLTWAIFGFIFIIIAFALSQFTQILIPTNENQTVTKISPPPQLPSQ